VALTRAARRAADGLVAAPRTLDDLPDLASPMAKPNYSFEKRQRELAKKKKQDEKEARKRAARESEASTPPRE
jgi:hypothetical protein